MSHAIRIPEPVLHNELGAGLSDRLDAVALNPQPLPPKEIAGTFTSAHEAVALNPQPLPPADNPFWYEAAGEDPAVGCNDLDETLPASEFDFEPDDLPRIDMDAPRQPFEASNLGLPETMI